MHQCHTLDHYLKSGGSSCPLCSAPITHREINHLLTSTHQHAIGREDVIVEEAACPQHHIWMEVYENNVMTTVWGA